MLYEEQNKFFFYMNYNLFITNLFNYLQQMILSSFVGLGYIYREMKNINLLKGIFYSFTPNITKESPVPYTKKHQKSLIMVTLYSSPPHFLLRLQVQNRTPIFLHANFQLQKRVLQTAELLCNIKYLPIVLQYIYTNVVGLISFSMVNEIGFI